MAPGRLNPNFLELEMTDDNRCCGTGTCIIDADGRCWCGQVWDGEKMCFQASAPDALEVPNKPAESPSSE